MSLEGFKIVFACFLLVSITSFKVVDHHKNDFLKSGVDSIQVRQLEEDQNLDTTDEKIYDGLKEIEPDGTDIQEPPLVVDPVFPSIEDQMMLNPQDIGENPTDSTSESQKSEKNESILQTQETEKLKDDQSDQSEESVIVVDQALPTLGTKSPQNLDASQNQQDLQNINLTLIPITLYSQISVGDTIHESTTHQTEYHNEDDDDQIQINPPPMPLQDLTDPVSDDFKAKRWSDHGHYNQEGQLEYKGLRVRCVFGCRICSNSSNITQCQTCMDGFSMDLSNQTCKKCNDVCLTCSSSDTSSCTSCYPGWTIKSSDSSAITCVKCTDTSCGVCQSVDNCTKCKNSFYLSSGGKCTNCIQDCKICTDNLSCSQCYNGYFVNVLTDGSQECKICSDGCAICTKLTDCQKCYPGFFLNNDTQTCEKCSENCWNCISSANCSRCIIGSFLVKGLCVKPIDYCAIMNPNGTCNQCFWGFTKSQDQISCIGSTSTDIQSLVEMVKQLGCKMREVLKEAKCQSCNSTFTNCQECNSTKCLRCMKGYLLLTDGTICNPCNSTLQGCKECENSIFCSQCSKGYFMEQDSNDTTIVSYGQCIKCNENCLTCHEKDVYCTSCNTGFGLSTSRTCVPQNQFNFTLLLNLDLADFTYKMDTFKAALLNLIKDPSVTSDQKENFLQITKISTGSIKVEGTMSASSASAIQNTKESFDAAISAGSTFAGIQVLSSGLSPIKYDQSTLFGTTSSSSSNTGMIIGTVVGVGCAVLIGIGISVYFLCYRKKESSVEKNINEKQATSTVDDFVMLQTISSNHGVNLQYPELENGKGTKVSI